MAGIDFIQRVEFFIEFYSASVLFYRLTYNDELINWCDVVVPCGGDGTFLLAASRVRDAK